MAQKSLQMSDNSFIFIVIYIAILCFKTVRNNKERAFDKFFQMGLVDA
jgi:hypothetical protein